MEATPGTSQVLEWMDTMMVQVVAHLEFHPTIVTTMDTVTTLASGTIVTISQQVGIGKRQLIQSITTTQCITGDTTTPPTMVDKVFTSLLKDIKVHTISVWTMHILTRTIQVTHSA